MSRIDAFLDALMATFGVMDEMSHWPLRVEEVAPYFSDVEAEDVLCMVGELHEQNLPKTSTAQLFISPSLIRELLPDLVIGLKAAGTPLETRVRCLEFFLDVLETMQNGDPFCRDGVNAIWTSQDVSDCLSNHSWIQSEAAHSKAIHMLSSSLLSMIWGLYFYPWANVGFEIHGPYDASPRFGEGTVLLVRDFFDLNPGDLWPDSQRLSHDSIRLLTVYRGVEIAIDMFDHVMHLGNLPQAMTAFSATADGMEIDAREAILRINSEMVQAAADHSLLLTGWTKEELVHKFIEIRYYCLRRLRLSLGRDWRPPKKVLERVDRWGLMEIEQNGSGLSLEMLRRAFDPHDDWYPR